MQNQVAQNASRCQAVHPPFCADLEANEDLTSSTSIEPVVLPMWTSRIVNLVMSPGSIQCQLRRCHLENVSRVRCHDLLVARVVHDDLPGADPVRELLEEQIVPFTVRFVVIPLDSDD